MERSRLSKFMENCRGSMSYRNFAIKINNLFTYTYLKYIESDLRTPDEEKWLSFAKMFNLDSVSAKDMLNEQRIHVGYNIKVKKLYKDIIKKGANEVEDKEKDS